MKHDRLKNLFDFLPKSKIKAGDGVEEGPYPFYTSSENQVKYLDKYLYDPGCLVFGTGGKASVHFTTCRFSTSTDCITIKPKPGTKIDAGYVFHYFKGNMQVLENGFKGAGLKHISKAYLSDIQIPHPEELENQNRIAYLLSKVEGLITQRKQHLQQLNNLLKSVFLEMFGDPVRNEKGWKKEPLVSLTRFITDGKHGDCNNDDGSGYFFISAKDIHDGIIDYSQSRQIVKEEFEEVHRRTDLRTNDLVMVNTGATIGKMAIVQSDKRTMKTTFQKSVAVIKPKHDILNVIYLKALFGIRLNELIKVSSGSAQQNLLLSQMRKIPVALPAIELQNQFAAIAEKVEDIKSHYQQSLIELKKLYGALSQKAFKGELDLSRVSLVPTDNQENPVVDDKPLFEEESAKEVDMFESLDKPAMTTPEGRERLLRQWFMDWVSNAKPTETLSVPQFWQEAQLQALDFEGEDEENIDFTIAEYDQFKLWLFEAIEQGQILQTQNIVSEPGEELRFGNRVVLKKAQ